MDTNSLKPHSPEEMHNSENEDSQFDSVMTAIGQDGKGYYQKRFNVIFNIVFLLLTTMTLMNTYMALSVPDHHCHVPGRNITNYTLTEWQALMLPKSTTSLTDKEELSSCEMYKRNNRGDPIINETQGCTDGWDYDTTWYTLTAPSQNDWVCDNEVKVADTYAASKIGEIVGLLVLAPLADVIGRKPVYYIALFLEVLGRMLTIVTSSYFAWFLFFTAVSSTSSSTLFQTTLIIGMEMNNEKGRKFLLLMQFISWTVGLCSLPLLTWMVGDWRVMMAATTLPGACAFCFYRVMPESPRWLASRGKVDQAMQVVDYIAKVNKKQRPKNAQQVIQAMARKKEKTYGLASLVANVSLARNTFLLNVCWMSSGITFYCLTMNATNLAGNPFMNFFWQSLMDLPGAFMGQFICNYLGRRWLNVAGFTAAASTSAVLLVTNDIPYWMSTTLYCCLKLSCSITYFVLVLLSVEVYPTCVRQTGSSIGGVVHNLAGILGAYIVLWGQTEDSRYPTAAVLIMSVAGGVCAAFLPETYGQKLPETLEDGRTFGAEQKFWSFNKTTGQKTCKNKGADDALLSNKNNVT